MRSEVVRMHREMCSDTLHPVGETAGMVLGRLLPEINFASASKLVRISVEIVDEKGEEKVGSKAVLEKFPRGDGGQLVLDGDIDLRSIFKDWQPGESRKVKSILFETPDGVPVVEFIETPRERLKRKRDEAYNKDDFENGYMVIIEAVNDYLAATEGEGK